MNILTKAGVIKSLGLKIVGLSILALQLSATSCGCTKNASGHDPEKPDSGDGKTVVVKPKYNSSKVLRNPLSGWVMYVSANSKPEYFNTEYVVPTLGQAVKVVDYASAVYMRTSWAKMNPADGVYAWNDPASNIYKLIHAAWDRGLPIAFRIVVDGRDQGANTPQFVIDAGAAYAIDDPKHPDRKTPMPQDPVFQKYYTKFVEAFAKEFNDPAKCAFIDGYGLGKWGEGHSVAYDTDNCSAVNENTETLKREVLDWITKLYAKNFTKIPLVINYHRVIGHPTSTGTPNPNSEALIALAVQNGYCLRHDAFGMTNPSWGYSTWEKGIAANYKFKRPIIMEGGYIVNQHSYWNDPAGYRQGHPEDVRKGEFEQSQEAHVNMMDFRVGAETASWFQDAFSLVQRFVAEGGYRVYPDQVTLPESASAGSRFSVSYRWRNMGWGYLPDNLPQWNYKYRVAVALLDADGAVKKVYIDTKTDPSEWVDGTAFPYTLDGTLDVPAGKYTWAIGIVDTTGDTSKTAIKLAVNGDITSRGWLKLSDMTVSD